MNHIRFLAAKNHVAILPMTRTLPNILAIALLAGVSQTWAQSSASIINLGYQRPRLPVVAPGQVLHLTLHGVTTPFNSTQTASTFPLPTNFNGLSISLQQSGSAKPIPVPLLRSVGSIATCSNVLAGLVPAGNIVPCAVQDTTLDLEVLIPFELIPNAPGIDNEGCNTAMPPVCQVDANDAVLTVAEKSGPGMSLRVYPVVDQVHILNSCTDGLPAFTGMSIYRTSPCYQAITHSDYTMVSTSSPAKPGEELVAFAFGLGLPDSAVSTGLGTPASGVPLSRTLAITFTGIGMPTATHPDYAGLVGGEAGLYQINFHVPEIPAGLLPCTQQNPFNLTMVLQGSSSADQASFCVQP